MTDKQILACLSCPLPKCVYETMGSKKLCPIHNGPLGATEMQNWCGVRSIDDCIFPIIECDSTELHCQQVRYDFVRNNI